MGHWSSSDTSGFRSHLHGHIHSHGGTWRSHFCCFNAESDRSQEQVRSGKPAKERNEAPLLALLYLYLPRSEHPRNCSSESLNLALTLRRSTLPAVTEGSAFDVGRSSAMHDVTTQLEDLNHGSQLCIRVRFGQGFCVQWVCLGCVLEQESKSCGAARTMTEWSCKSRSSKDTELFFS
jgi:hypothetical protein